LIRRRRIAKPDNNVGNDMSTPQMQRDQWREAARATRSSLTGPLSPGPILGPIIAFIDHIIATQTKLISSYMGIASSVARQSHTATPTAATAHLRAEDDQSAQAHRDPAQALSTDSIEARAYEIFVQRGREPGNPVDDWRRAEAELRGEMTG